MKHAYPGRLVAVEKRRRHLRKFKQQPCADCGKRFPWYVMELDHIKRKRLTKHGRRLTFTAIVARSWKLLLQELAQCDVVCGNCHNRRSYRRQQWG